MGIFQDMTTVINRTPVRLRVTFDGQSIEIPPGESLLPRVTVPYAKNQNPIRGSQDMNNPNISGALYLVSIKGKKGDPQEALTEEEWAAHLSQVSRYDLEAYFGDKLGPKEHFLVRGKGPTQAKGSFDKGVRVTTGETFVQSE